MTLPSILDYCPEILEKTAESERPRGGIARGLKVLGAGTLGFGAGTLAGAGALELANRAHQHAYGMPIPTNTFYKIAPVLGGAMGLTYALFKAREQEELRRAFQNQPDRSSPGVSL
jgi:hypothetical protein